LEPSFILILMFLKSSEELAFLFGSLEATITELARGVDKLERDLFARSMGRLVKNSLSQSKDSLSGSSGGSLDHDEVFTNHTVMMEAAHRVDRLLSHIELGGATLVVGALSNSVDLLVDISSVEVTSLTSSGNGVLNSARMPSTNTSDLS